MTRAPQLPPWADAEASRILPDLCGRGEGQTIEFKERLPSQAHDIAKSIAAFASTNDGYLIYGVNNEGRIVGLSDTQRPEVRDEHTLRIIGSAKTIRPPVHPTITWALYQELVVCVVRISKGTNAPYYSNNRPMVRRANVSRPAEPEEVEQIVRSRIASAHVVPPSQTSRQIGKRMRRVLELMNSGRLEPWTISDLARGMHLRSPADLDVVMTGNSPVSFEIVDRFSDAFAANKEWLLTGRGAPFASALEPKYLPEEYLSLINESRPEALYAVRSRSVAGEAFFVIESTPLKHWVLPSFWHVSSQVGGGGSRQLVSLYDLFRNWIDSEKSYLVLGRLIDDKLAQSVINGDAHPGIVARQPLSHWWDDLTDLDHQWTSRKGSERAYGSEFVAAQDIIRRMLGRANPRSSPTE